MAENTVVETVVAVHPKLQKLQDKQLGLVAKINLGLVDSEVTSTEIIGMVRDCKNLHKEMDEVVKAIAILEG